MVILGLSFFYHDSAAALIRDGVVLSAAEEERFTRVKHDNRFPANAIQFCLQNAGIVASDVDYVVFFEKPGLKLDRILQTVCKRYPHSKALFANVLRTWGTEKLWAADIIASRMGVPKSKVLFSEHHLSHAASSFYCSPFMDAAVCTLDGVGEWICGTLGTASGNQFDREHSMLFPHSLGLLYTALTSFLGFEVNEGEYKVMGMAPYGKPLYTDKIEKLFKQRGAQGIELDMRYFEFDHSLDRTYSSAFEDLFGAPRKKEEPFFVAGLGGDVDQASDEVARRSTYFADIAASLQAVVEDSVVTMAKGLKQAHPEQENIVCAGGVAYNSVANGKVLREAGFRNLYIQPAAGDSGGAIGAALAAYYAICPRTKPEVLGHAYLGYGDSVDQMRQTLVAKGVTFWEAADEDSLTEKVAGLLADGKVVGWYQGRAEFGPRALGNRSILADPRRSEMRDVVNARIKFRELFRPFAPACREDYGNTYYDLPYDDPKQYPYRFMLCVVPVRDQYRDHLAATTHVDGSARVQMVGEDGNPLFHKLISAFGDRTGTYCLLNTSFNRRGEPIVQTSEDAIRVFEWSDMDVLALGPFVICR